MLRPSYAELMDILNKESEKNDVITSRYTIVIAAAKRARQLIDGDEPMVEEVNGKPVSTAVKELAENKIKIVPEGQGTVLKLKKDENIQNEINEELNGEIDEEELNESEEENDFDFEDDELDIDDYDDDEFEDIGISDTMIEEEGEF